MRRLVAGLFAAFLVPAAAYAQGGPVQQTGPVTPGRVPSWVTNGVLGDGGPAVRGNIRELGLTNTGAPLCINDRPATGPHHQLCLGALAQNGGIISYQALGGAEPLPLQISVNGELQGFGVTHVFVGEQAPPNPIEGQLWWNGLTLRIYAGGAWETAGGGGGGTGPQGPQGPAGPGATITIGTVTTTAPGTNASVTNTGTATNAVLNFNLPQGPIGPPGGGGGGGTAGTGPGWTVLTPSPSGDDTAAINNDLATSTQGVLLTGGTFHACSPIIVPRYKTLAGTGVPMYISGTSGQTPAVWPGNSVITCTSTTNGFDVSGQNNPSLPGAAMVNLHDDTVVEGVAISGLSPITGGNDSNKVACINATSTQGITIRNSVMANCYLGVRLRSDASVLGDQGSLVQEFSIHDNTMWWVTDGVELTDNGGQGTTDWRIYNNEIELPTFAGIYTSTNQSCIGYQIMGNRIEDGNLGIVVSCNQGVINSNFFSNMNGGLMQFAAQTYGLSVVGNVGLNVNGVQAPCFDILGQMTGSSFQSNSCLYGYGAVWKLESGGSVQNILINDLPLHSQGGPPFFADDPTTTALSQWTVPLIIPGHPWTP